MFLTDHERRDAEPEPQRPIRLWDDTDRRLKPTRLRSLGARMIGEMGDHKSPRARACVDATGQPWLGATRVIDRPARRKAQRGSWRKALAAR